MSNGTRRIFAKIRIHESAPYTSTASMDSADADADAMRRDAASRERSLRNQGFHDAHDAVIESDDAEEAATQAYAAAFRTRGEEGMKNGVPLGEAAAADALRLFRERAK